MASSRNPEYPATFRGMTAAEGMHVASTHPQHEALLACSYGGFVRESASTYGASTHAAFRRTFAGLQAAGFFQYDLAQPDGPNTKLRRTTVTRALVGDPGMTYLLGGVRMFAHPWEPSWQSHSEQAGGALATRLR